MGSRLDTHLVDLMGSRLDAVPPASLPMQTVGAASLPEPRGKEAAFRPDRALPVPVTVRQLRCAAGGRVSGATKLRHMLQRTSELIVCPGVYDGLSARTAIELSFDAMYMVGALQCC